jgi:hypothetical protein
MASACLVACLAIGCDGGTPEPPDAPSAAAIPPDHPPLTAGPAARPPTLPPETVLATVGDRRVTAGDMDDALAAMPSPDRLEYSTSDKIRELLESLIDRSLMADAARREGLAEDPVMKEMLGGRETAGGLDDDQMLADVWLETALAGAAQPTEADVARYYREHVAEFTEPARVRVLRVVAADEGAAARLRVELGRGATLAALRAAVPTQARSAEELWLQDLPKQPELTTLALGLTDGQVSPVVAVADGFAVLRAEERVPARVRPLDEVREGIRAGLQDEARRAALAGMRARLRKGIAIAIDESRLASYLPPPAGSS